MELPSHVRDPEGNQTKHVPEQSSQCSSHGRSRSMTMTMIGACSANSTASWDERFNITSRHEKGGRTTQTRESQSELGLEQSKRTESSI